MYGDVSHPLPGHVSLDKMGTGAVSWEPGSGGGRKGTADSRRF